MYNYILIYLFSLYYYILYMFLSIFNINLVSILYNKFLLLYKTNIKKIKFFYNYLTYKNYLVLFNTIKRLIKIINNNSLLISKLIKYIYIIKPDIIYKA